MRSEPDNNRPFWILSGVVHVTLLVILFLSPVGQSFFQPKPRPLKPEIIRKDEELAEVIQDVRDLATDRLKSQVALLEAGRERMATNFDTMNAFLQPFVASQIASARDRLLQEGQKTLALQKRILEAAEKAVQEKEGASDAMWRAYDGNRAALVVGQEEIRRVLMLTMPDDDRLVAMQNEAETNQEAAFEALTESVAAQNHLWNAPKKMEALDSQLQDLGALVATYQERIDANAVQRKELQEAERAALQQMNEAQADFERLQKQEGSIPESDLKRAGDLVKQKTKGYERLQDRVTSNARQEEGLKTRLQNSRERLEDRLVQLEAARTELPGKTETRDARTLLAAEYQRKALSSQTAVYKQLLDLLKTRIEEEATDGNKTEPNSAATDLEDHP